MAVLTRSCTAAERGQNTTRPNTNQAQIPVAIRGTAVKGAAYNRKPARGRNAKAGRAQKHNNPKECEESASVAPCLTAASSSRDSTRRNDDSNGRAHQPQATSQSTSQTCGLYFEFTFGHVITLNSTASTPKTGGAASKKPRKGRRTTKRGPNAKAKTGRAVKQEKESQSTAVASAGTKRRREDDEYQQEESSEDEPEPAPAPRTLRRVRRKTEKAAAQDAVNRDAVVEAVDRVRRRKGKAEANDVPTTEEATVGSKRRRDEDNDDIADASQKPMDPGPSHRPMRRTRQKVENPSIEDSEKKAVRKPKGRRTAVPTRLTRRTTRKRATKIQTPQNSQASTPTSCESEEPSFIPSRAPSPEEHETSPEEHETEEQPEPQEAPREVLVKQEEMTPTLFPRQPPSRQINRKEEPPMSPLMLPEPLVPIANAPSQTGPSIVKAEERSSTCLDREVSLSPGGSDKENEPPQSPGWEWPVPFEVVMPLRMYSPEVHDPAAASEPDDNVIDVNSQGENQSSFLPIPHPYPRQPLEPLASFSALVPATWEVNELDFGSASSSEDGDIEYPNSEGFMPKHAASGTGLRPATVEREVPPCGCNGDGSNDDAEAGPASLLSSPPQLPANVPKSIGGPQRCSSKEVEELPEGPSSFYRAAISRYLDQIAQQEHESPVSRMAEPGRISPVTSEAAIAEDTHERSEEAAVTRPSPSAPDPSLQYLHTAAGTFRLPPCKCGNPARHFVVHSGGEASEYSFMGDDEDF